jgi:hypothetical protein
LQKLPDGSALKPDSATLCESLIASRLVSSALHLLSQFSQSTAEKKHKLIVLRNMCSATWLSSFWIHHYAVNNLLVTASMSLQHYDHLFSCYAVQCGVIVCIQCWNEKLRFQFESTIQVATLARTSSFSFATAICIFCLLLPAHFP